MQKAGNKNVLLAFAVSPTPCGPQVIDSKLSIQHPQVKRTIPVRRLDKKLPERILPVKGNILPPKGKGKTKPWKRLADFIETLKINAEQGRTGVIDLVSGPAKKSVLKRLYDSDPALALELLRQRLRALEKEFDDPELLGVFDHEGSSLEEWEIAEMQSMLNTLENRKNTDDFDKLLHYLRIFEDEQNRVPFEYRCDIALLKRARITDDENFLAIPEHMRKFAFHLLDPEDISKTTTGIWKHYKTDAVEYFVQKTCEDEGKKRENSLLHNKVQEFLAEGEVDLGLFSLEENIQRLCHTKSDDIYQMLLASSREVLRGNPALKNPLSDYENEDDKIEFLRTVLQDEDNEKNFHFRAVISSHIIGIYEKHLLNKIAFPTNENDNRLLGCLANFTRLAQSLCYEVDDKINQKLETLVLDEMREYMEKAGAGEAGLWGLDNFPKKNIKIAFEKRNTKQEAKCIKALREYILVSRSVKSLDDEKQALKAKEKLLKLQIERLFERARHHIDNRKTLRSASPAAFSGILNTILSLENQRPPASLLKEKTEWAEVIGGIGHYLLKGKEVPVGQRLRDIHLEYQLKYHFSYDFKHETITCLSRIPGQVANAVGAVTGHVKNTVTHLYRTVTGNFALSAMFRENIGLAKGTSNALLDTIKADLNDYAELCKIHPHMARLLAGNIAQTIAIIENTVGQGSELYSIFNQFQQRVGMEAMAIHLVEQFSPEDIDISNLDAEKASALKRMFALCQLFQWAPEAVTGTVGSADIVSNILSGSAIGTSWAAMKTAFRVVSTHAVKQTVSALSDEDVKGMNTMIMTLRHGPEEAVRRLQTMETAAEFIADKIKGNTFKYSVVKAFLRPLTVRFIRIKKYYKQWKNGEKSGWPLALELLKMAAVTTPVAGSLVTAPLVVMASGPAVAGYVLLSGPLTALFFVRLFYRLDPHENTMRLVQRHVSGLLKPNMSMIIQQARQRAGITINTKRYDMIKKHMAYESLYVRFWPTFKEKKPSVAQELERNLADLRKEKSYMEGLDRAQNLAKELRALETLLENEVNRDTVIAQIEDEQVKNQVPADKRGAFWWTTARVQQLRESLFQALGTDLIPGNESALEARFYNFHVRRAMVELMLHEDTAVSQALPHAQREEETRLKYILEKHYERAAVSCVRNVALRSVIQAAGNDEISGERFYALSGQSEKTSETINEEIGILKQVFSNVVKTD